MPLGSSLDWTLLIAALVVLLVVDLLLVRGRGGDMPARVAAVWSVVWIAIAVGFGGLLYLFGTTEQSTTYLAGYLVEKSLSLDNVFVFLVVFGAFAIPTPQRMRLLTYGIVLALVLRLLFILAGAAALENASWLTYPFAALLGWTGWRLWKHRNDHDGDEKLIEGVKSRMTIAEGDHGDKLLTKIDGKRMLTTAGATLVAIAVVDIIFAVDSVPAILGITTDTYVVFAANAFALLGLRPLFFLVAELVARLRHLKAALAALLVFIAAKMVYGEIFGKVGPEWSLGGVVLILGAGVVASLPAYRREKALESARD
jgi:tellurite resistance protein TerC